MYREVSRYVPYPVNCDKPLVLGGFSGCASPTDEDLSWQMYESGTLEEWIHAGLTFEPGGANPAVKPGVKARGALSTHY